jgi:hypothetical protein
LTSSSPVNVEFLQQVVERGRQYRRCRAHPARSSQARWWPSRDSGTMQAREQHGAERVDRQQLGRVGVMSIGARCAIRSPAS